MKVKKAVMVPRSYETSISWISGSFESACQVSFCQTHSHLVLTTRTCERGHKDMNICMESSKKLEVLIESSIVCCGRVPLKPGTARPSRVVHLTQRSSSKMHIKISDTSDLTNSRARAGLDGPSRVLLLDILLAMASTVNSKPSLSHLQYPRCDWKLIDVEAGMMRSLSKLAQAMPFPKSTRFRLSRRGSVTSLVGSRACGRGAWS